MNIFRKCACITLIPLMDAAPDTSAQSVNLCPETYEEVIVAPENLQSRQ